MTPVP